MKSGDATTVSCLTSHCGERDARPIFLQRKVEFVVEEEPPAKNPFFLLHDPPGFLQNRGKSGLTGPPPDIALAGPVQNILKKVKKRLVSPLKPR